MMDIRIKLAIVIVFTAILGYFLLKDPYCNKVGTIAEKINYGGKNCPR